MTENYSLEQIRDAVLADRVVLAGTSPAVSQQNELIARMLATGSELEAPAILGTQLIGSRAQGSSGLKSDLDVAIITYEDQRSTASKLTERLQTALLPAGIEVDSAVAPSVLGIYRSVPATPAKFISQIAFEPRLAASFYEAGAYDTPALRLAALAASEVMLFEGWEEAQSAWDTLRPVHTRAYIGRHDRFCDRVAHWLQIPILEVAGVITEEIWRARTEKFSLPANFADHYWAGREWLAAQSDIPEAYAQSMVIFESAQEEKYRQAQA